MFDPAAEGVASQISANQKAFGHGSNATFAFVSDEENTDEVYLEDEAAANCSNITAEILKNLA